MEPSSDRSVCIQNPPVETSRIGSVPYLNAIPLTAGMEQQVVLAPPSQLAGMLQHEMLDAALVSIIEPLLNPGYLILDGVAVASDGPVLSVYLATKVPLESIKVVHCDSASLTSLNLLRVLLAARGLTPEFRPLQDYQGAMGLDSVLLIGDPAITFRQQNPPHQLWDLGQAWQELTGLPFVYAVWAIRESQVQTDLLKKLWDAKQLGMEQLDTLVAKDPRFDLSFRKSYVGSAIHYDLGEKEKKGVTTFVDQLRNLVEGPIFDPRFVQASRHGDR